MAFHFMSMDHCAKLAQGKFDMDNMIRICDLVFKKDGVVTESNFSQGDEMIGVLGRRKTTPGSGGDVRSQFKSSNSKVMCGESGGFTYGKDSAQKEDNSSVCVVRQVETAW